MIPSPRVLTVSIPIIVLLSGSCAAPDGPQATETGREAKARALPAALAMSPDWLDFHDPDLSLSGNTLALDPRGVPFLMDMNGRVVHAWPDVRASGRATLMPTGQLAVLGAAGHLEEYDWDGRQTWSFTPPGPFDMLHHDFARLGNGNYLLLVLNRTRRADYVVEVDREGKEVWRWSTYEAIPEDLAEAPGGDRTHTNSVQELPTNRWFDEGHEAFRPGNILLSMRNLNTLYIVERPSGEVVWRHTGGLDWQHEARMIPAGYPGEGNILVFNNGYLHRSTRRESSILELDPVDHSVTWSYRSPGFFSATVGMQQALANGNLLVTSTGGGRAFEITREGRIVWQWAPPSGVVRASRYPLDFCPQLASLTPPAEVPVRRREPEQFLDADLYAFALTHGVRRVKDNGGVVTVLRHFNNCEQLRLPDNPELRVSYGILPWGRCAEGSQHQVRFAVSIRPSGATSSEDLLVRAIHAGDFEREGPGPALLRQETLSLRRFERQSVEMCLSLASFAGGPPPPCFIWGPPTIRPAGRPPDAPFEELRSPEVEEHQRRQLEALGYIN